MVKRKEDQGVIGARLSFDVVNQSRRPWTQPPYPIELIGTSMRSGQQSLGVLPETSLMRLAHRKAPDEHTAHAILAFERVVVPCARLARTRGQNFDIVTGSQLFCQQSTRMLGSEGDLGAIAWRDECKLHAVAPRVVWRT
jgi:hypothetical protein